MPENSIKIKLKIKDEQGKFHSFNPSLEQLYDLGIKMYCHGLTTGLYDIGPENLKDLRLIQLENNQKIVEQKIVEQYDIDSTRELIRDGHIQDIFKTGTKKRYSTGG
jgi:hypothetical protein